MRKTGHEQQCGMQQTRERAFWLDVLRILLCAGVVVSHYSGPPLIGAACVDGFFVLSGFLLAGGFERMRQKGGMDVCTFYQSKLIRLMPTLLASLLLGFLCVLSRHFLLSSEYAPLYPSWLGSDFRLSVFMYYYNIPSWYMACECAFLTLAPFLYYVYNSGKGRLQVLLTAAFAFTAALYFKDGISSPFANELHYEPLVRLWQFIAGLCAWRMFANVQFASYKKAAVFVLCALTVIVLVVATTVKQGHYWSRAFAFDTVMVLLFMATISISAKLPAPRSLRLGTTFAYLAALTYPVYLYHVLVQQIVNWFFRGLIQLPNVVLILIAACATLVLSVLSLRYLDGFFARRKN